MWIVQSHLHFHLFQRYGQGQKEKVRLCKIWVKTRKDCRYVPFWKHKSIKHLFFLSWCVKDFLGNLTFVAWWMFNKVLFLLTIGDRLGSFRYNRRFCINQKSSDIDSWVLKCKWILWIPHYLFRILRLNLYIKSGKHIYVQYSKVFHFSASWMWCLSGQDTFNNSFNNTLRCRVYILFTTYIFLKSIFFFLNKAEVWQPSLNYSTPPPHQFDCSPPPSFEAFMLLLGQKKFHDVSYVGQC